MLNSDEIHNNWHNFLFLHIVMKLLLFHFYEIFFISLVVTVNPEFVNGKFCYIKSYSLELLCIAPDPFSFQLLCIRCVFQVIINSLLFVPIMNKYFLLSFPVWIMWYNDPFKYQILWMHEVIVSILWLVYWEDFNK